MISLYRVQLRSAFAARPHLNLLLQQVLHVHRQVVNKTRDRGVRENLCRMLEHYTNLGKALHWFDIIFVHIKNSSKTILFYCILV